MSKINCKAQEIGDLGESLIPTWALKHNTKASKYTYDLGFDFSFQVLEKNEFNGKVFVAQCKAVEQTTKYVKLDVDDLSLHLISNMPVCLLGVDTVTETIKYRFVDNELIDKYCDAIMATQKSLSIPFSELHEDATFYTDCLKYCKPALTESKRIHTIDKLISTFAPGTVVKSETDSEGVVSLKMITSAVTNIIQPNSIFGKQKLSPEYILNEDIREILKTYYPDYNCLKISGRVCSKSKFSFGDKEVQTVCYPYKDHLHYKMKSGFTLVVSKCEHGCHHFSFNLEDSKHPLLTCIEDCDFISSYNEKSLFSIEDCTFIKNIHDEYAELGICFELASDAIALAKNTSIDFSKFFLSDLNNDDCCFTIHFLSLLKLGKITEFPFVQDVQDDDLPALRYGCDTEGTLPIVFTLNGKRYLVECKCNFQKVILKDRICGLVIKNLVWKGVRFEKENEIEFEEPKLCITKQLPAIPANLSIKGRSLAWNTIVKESQYLLPD